MALYMHMKQLPLLHPHSDILANEKKSGGALPPSSVLVALVLCKVLPQFKRCYDKGWIGADGCAPSFSASNCNHERSSANQRQPLKFVYKFGVTGMDCCVVVAFCIVPFIKGNGKRSLEMRTKWKVPRSFFNIICLFFRFIHVTGVP